MAIELLLLLAMGGFAWNSGCWPRDREKYHQVGSDKLQSLHESQNLSFFFMVARHIFMMYVCAVYTVPYMICIVPYNIFMVARHIFICLF